MPFDFLRRKKVGGAEKASSKPAAGRPGGYGIPFDGLTEEWRIVGNMQIETRLSDALNKRESVTIQRFKGLGEMNPGQLWETTLCPDTRRLLQVRIEDRERTYAIFNMLMSKREAEKRCAWMEEKGDTVEADV